MNAYNTKECAQDSTGAQEQGGHVRVNGSVQSFENAHLRTRNSGLSHKIRQEEH